MPYIFEETLNLKSHNRQMLRDFVVNELIENWKKSPIALLPYYSSNARVNLHHKIINNI